jgi:type II restriction/modification system DNA methylase subunit YeeA
MNKSKLKSYAPQARKDFIAAITTRANQLGLSDKAGSLEIAPAEKSGDVVIIAGQPWPAKVQGQREQLIKRIHQDGYTQTMEAVAYTWFNRFAALRYMEIHDYLDHGHRVLSNREGGMPEILNHATELELPGFNKAKAIELKLAGNKDGELYKMLLVAQCNALSNAMPFLFERIDDETELLLPDNLLRTNSLIHKLVAETEEEDWQEIEIVGWLYQFYISEKKDEVIGSVVKSEDIPAATQLFTPNWIVKYMVQNSLGAQWLATYPHSPLKGSMEYYIEPAEQTTDVKAQLAVITPRTLNPEELTLIDPASGSGHILVEAYELFKAIYLERGYRLRDVAQLILEKNLFGLDIDERAAQLTGFALMMKGRADDQRLFERGVKLNVMALVDSAGFDAEGLANGVKLSNYELKSGDLTELEQLFEHATTFGSLIQVPEGLAKKIPALKQLSEVTSQDLFVSETLKRLRLLVQQMGMLAAQYDAVVANPPYMGSGGMNVQVKRFLQERYKGYEKDLFIAFIDRNLSLSKPHGRLGFMSPFVWMFISSHQYLRARLINKETITSLIQLEYSAFDGATVPICTFTLQAGHVNGQKSCYIRLSDFRGSRNQGPRALEAIRNRDCGWFFEAVQDVFNKIESKPIAYWLSPNIFDLFEEESVGDFFITEGQNKTTNNDQYLRHVWEVATNKIGVNQRWLLCAKGGSFRKWAGNLDYLIDWSLPVRKFYRTNFSARIIDEKYWYREGITWTDITSSSTAFRYLPRDTTYETKGPTVFAVDIDKQKQLLGYLNTKIVRDILKALNPTLSTKIIDVRTLPIKSLLLESKPLGTAVETLILLATQDWNAYERSMDFQSVPILTASTEPMLTLESSYTTWTTRNRDIIVEMKHLEEENNRLFIDAYGLEAELTPDVPIEQVTLTVNPAYRYGGKLTEEKQWIRFRQDTMEELVSYAIGCMMGRYSLDEPGLIYAHAGNVGFEPGRYATFLADTDGIVPITDELWFSDDAPSRIREFLRAVWGPDTLEENMAWLAESLGIKASETPDETVRRYIADKFFKDHLQTYKKRPIYWLFSSGKQGAFQALVYLHRYNESTLARMRSEYVVPLTSKIQSRIEMLTKDAEAATSTAARNKLNKEIETLRKKHVELLAYDEKLRHYADMRIQLDLDDGVKVNYGKFGDLLAEVKAVTGGAGDE